MKCLVFRKGEIGFSLVEVMIAIAIVVIGLFAFLRLASRGYAFTTSYNHEAKAAQLLHQLLEETSFVPFAEINRVCGSSLQNEWIDIPELLYPKTLESLADFRSAQSKSWKDFGHTAKIKARRNELGQIVLLSMKVSLSWRVLGKVDNQSSPLREVRDGTIVSNPEAILGITP